jgi:hypothetical protein
LLLQKFAPRLPLIDSWPSLDAGCYVELFKNIAAAIRECASLAVRWEEATAVIEMIELAKKSSSEGLTIDVPHL